VTASGWRKVECSLRPLERADPLSILEERDGTNRQGPDIGGIQRQHALGSTYALSRGCL
jgi:hypothetical protein